MKINSNILKLQTTILYYWMTVRNKFSSNFLQFHLLLRYLVILFLRNNQVFPNRSDERSDECDFLDQNGIIFQEQSFNWIAKLQPPKYIVPIDELRLYKLP